MTDSDSYTVAQAAEWLAIPIPVCLHEIKRGRLRARFTDGSGTDFFVRKISMQYWQALHGHKQASSSNETGFVIASK